MKAVSTLVETVTSFWMLSCITAQSPEDTCRVLFNLDTQTVYGLCQVSVSSRSRATGCYWFLHTRGQQASIPFVGVLQVEELSDSSPREERFAAFCSILRHLPGFQNETQSFSVKLAPDFATSYSARKSVRRCFKLRQHAYIDPKLHH